MPNFFFRFSARKMINVSLVTLSWILNIPNWNTFIVLEEGSSESEAIIERKHLRLSLQIQKTTGSDDKSTTTSQPFTTRLFQVDTHKTPTSSIVVEKDTEPEKKQIGIGYGMFTPEPFVCLVWMSLLPTTLDLWSLHSRSSHPPLQDLAEMSPVSMCSSTTHDLFFFFAAARTSGSSDSAHLSPAVHTTFLSSSSNSDIMTSTPRRLVVALSFRDRHLTHHCFRIYRHCLQDFDVKYGLRVFPQANWICCPQVPCNPSLQRRSYQECAGNTQESKACTSGLSRPFL